VFITDSFRIIFLVLPAVFLVLLFVLLYFITFSFRKNPGTHMPDPEVQHIDLAASKLEAIAIIKSSIMLRSVTLGLGLGFTIIYHVAVQCSAASHLFPGDACALVPAKLPKDEGHTSLVTKPASARHRYNALFVSCLVCA
jgi:hypothetical protein